MADVNAVKATKKTNKLGDYFRGIKTELKKVVWPTRKETYRYTVVVIVICLLFALLFWLLDTGALLVLEQVLKISL